MRFLVLLLMTCALNIACLHADLPAIESDLLDSTHLEKAESAVDKAIESGHPDSILIAMHNKRLGVQVYCLEKVMTLPKAVGAPLLADILLDDTLYVFSGVPMEKHSNYAQIRMRDLITEAACQFLGDALPDKAFSLTTAMKHELAAKLKSVK